MFLEECKYIIKQKKMSKYIDDDLNISSDEPGEEVSHKDISDV